MDVVNSIIAHASLPTQIVNNPCFDPTKKLPGCEKIPKTGFCVRNLNFSATKKKGNGHLNFQLEKF